MKKRPRPSPLVLEALEDRWLPALFTSTVFDPAVFDFDESALQVEAADFDGQNGDDLAVHDTGLAVDDPVDGSLQSVGAVRIFLNDGAGGRFTAAGDLLPTEGRLQDSAVGDFDGDGHADVVLISIPEFTSTTTPLIQVFRGDGQGGFTAADPRTLDTSPGLFQPRLRQGGGALPQGAETSGGQSPRLCRHPLHYALEAGRADRE